MKNKVTLRFFLISFALHLLIGLVLIISINFKLPTEKPKKTAPLIHATVVSKKSFDDLMARKKQKILTEQRRIDQIKKEKERLKREKALKKKQKALKKKQKALKKKQKALKKKQKAQKIKAQKIKAQKIKEQKIKEQKLVAEKKVKEKKEAQRKHQAKLDELMQADFNKSFSSAKSTKELSEINRYKALIKDKISRNWQVDSNMKNKSCTLGIRLAADGLVLSVTRSEGDPEVCNSAKRATFKARTLPIPADPKILQQFLDFDITLEPNL